MTKAYRTLFAGTLVQESFLSLGGTDDPWTTVDSPFCRDGLGRPTLRGSAIAGALVATLRRLRGTVPAEVSGAVAGRFPSVWRTFHSHPDKEAFALRQHVAIDFETGAAAEKALYNVETLPPGTRWPFLLEVNTHRFEEGRCLALEALAEWQCGRCWMGREVARGLGWLRLEELTEYALTDEHVDLWPNAYFDGDDWHSYLHKMHKTFGSITSITVPQPKSPSPARHILDLSGTLIVGEREGDGYGLDSLSIGGHAADDLALAWDTRFLAPEGEHSPGERFDPDRGIAMLREPDGEGWKPYIPGSSLRGSLRHALRRWMRQAHGDVGMVDKVFGTTENSARLLIRDLLPLENEEFRLAWLQQHAEDEFAGATFGSHLFNRVAVMQGAFSWRMVLEADSAEELRRYYECALRPLFDLAEDGQIGLGGGQWRSHGWVRWTFDTALPRWESAA